MGDYSQSQLTLAKTLREQATNETDTTRASALLEQAQQLESNWGEGGSYRIALHTVTGGLNSGLSGALSGAATASAAPLLNDLQANLTDTLKKAGASDTVALGIAQSISGVTAAGIGAAAGGAGGNAIAGAATGVNIDANNRQLHPTEEKMIKDNAKRFAKQVYATENPTPEQITAALSLLANTAQNLVDNNMGYNVPYSTQAEAFLHTLQSEYAATSPNLSIGNGQYLFYATPDQKSSPYINMGTQDKEIAGIIIKAPIRSLGVENANGIKRDPATNFELDSQGRYSQRIIVDGKIFEPKYFSCPVVSAGCGGQNLDMSDAQTIAYVRALDKKIFDDIGKGATGLAIVAPVGTLGVAAGIIGASATSASGYLDGNMEGAIANIALQKAAQQYVQRVYGITEVVASRVVSLIELAGGWQSFINRMQHQNKTEVAKNNDSN